MTLRFFDYAIAKTSKIPQDAQEHREEPSDRDDKNDARFWFLWIESSDGWMADITADRGITSRDDAFSEARWKDTLLPE